jgi:hypothetical protein
MDVSRVAPVGSTRRVAAQVVRDIVRQPSQVRHRLNKKNATMWRRFGRVEAMCNICGHRGTLVYEWPDVERFQRFHIGLLRETLRCRNCFSKMRDRTLAAGLLDIVEKKYQVTVETLAALADSWPDNLRVLDTDANGRLAGTLAQCPGYATSLYSPDQENGALLRPGVRNVDLEQMPFPDGSFDVIITSEVMEHVRHLDTAHGEISRCLDEAGTYLFTVPYDEGLARTWDLIDPITDTLLVHPPHMHGDPGLRDEGIKSYRVFGRDIGTNMERTGLVARFVQVQRPECGIFGGDLFTARHISARSAQGDAR